MDFTKIKNFCISKHSFNKVLSGARGWEKILTHLTSIDKGLVFRIYQVFSKLNNKTTIQLLFAGYENF